MTRLEKAIADRKEQIHEQIIKCYCPNDFGIDDDCVGALDRSRCKECWHREYKED